jgi:hypothetical protein
VGYPQLRRVADFFEVGGGLRETYGSKGDSRRLREWVRNLHNTPLPVGLFIPFKSAWLAVKEFIETDGALPKSIEWVANRTFRPVRFPILSAQCNVGSGLTRGHPRGMARTGAGDGQSSTRGKWSV